MSDDLDTHRDICEVDGKPIRVMAFIGTGVCSDDCRKIRDGEKEE